MSKKASNIPKGGIPDKPDYPGPRSQAPGKPKAPRMILNKESLVKIFNEWNKRYSENPNEFSDSLDENGKPIDDYGECCAIYFQKLSDELKP